MEIIPDSSVSFQVVSFAASFIACLCSSLVGGGAGLVLLPILLLLGIPYVNALACHKLAVGFIGIGSGYRFIKEGLIDWKVFWWTGLSGIPFVLLGVVFAGRVSGETMKPILAIAILAMVLFSLLKKNAHLEHNPRNLVGRQWCIATLLLLPMAFHSGWVSAGAGIFTTYLYLMYFRYDQLHATAMTLTANGIFWNGVGALGHVFLGHVLWSLAPGLVVGAILGSYCGASIGIKKGNRFLRIAFLSAAALTGSLLLLRG